MADTADFAHLGVLERTYVAMAGRPDMTREALSCLDATLRLQLKLFGDDNTVVQKTRRQLVVGMNTAAMELLATQDLETCRIMLKKAQMLADAGSDAALRVLTLNNTACLHRHLGDAESSLELLRCALRAAEAQSSCTVATTHLNFCALFHALGQHNRALGHAQSAVFHAQEELAAAGDGSDGGDAPDGTERGVTLAIAYHNMAVELERTERLADSVLWFRKAARALRPFQSACPGLFESFSRASGLAEQNAALLPQTSQAREPVDDQSAAAWQVAEVQPPTGRSKPGLREAWGTQRVLGEAVGAPEAHTDPAAMVYQERADDRTPRLLTAKGSCVKEVAESCSPREASGSEWERTVKSAGRTSLRSACEEEHGMRRRGNQLHSVSGPSASQGISHDGLAAGDVTREPLALLGRAPGRHAQGAAGNNQALGLTELGALTAARLKEEKMQRARRRRRQKQEDRMQRKREKRNALMKMVHAHQMAQEALHFLKKNVPLAAPQRHDPARLPRQENASFTTPDAVAPAERLGLSRRLRNEVQAGRAPWADAMRINRAAARIHIWLRNRWSAAAVCRGTAARVVQCAVRGRQARSAVARKVLQALRSLAATRLQAFVLVHLGRARTAVVCCTRTRAVCIQALARGFLVRKQAAVLRQIRAEISWAAAVVLQANWRMWSSQLAKTALHTSNLAESAHLRRNAVRAAAVTVQAYWRTHLSFGRYQQYRALRDEHAQTLLAKGGTRRQRQLAVLGKRRGVLLVERRQEAFRRQARGAACVQLQAVIRGMLCRNLQALQVARLLWQRTTESEQTQPRVATALPGHNSVDNSRASQSQQRPTIAEPLSRCEMPEPAAGRGARSHLPAHSQPEQPGREPSAALLQSEKRGRDGAKQACAESAEAQRARNTQRRLEARQNVTSWSLAQLADQEQGSATLQRSERRGREVARQARVDSLLARKARDTQRRLEARQHAAVFLRHAGQSQGAPKSTAVQKSAERAWGAAETCRANSKQAQRGRETQRRLTARAEASEVEVEKVEQARKMSHKKRRLATERRLRAEYEAVIQREAKQTARQDAHHALVRCTAAVTIQALLRGSLLRTRVTKHQIIVQARQVESMAVVLVQSCFRRCIARRCYVRLWAVSAARRTECRAATAIQSSWRAWVALRMFSLLVLVRNCAVVAIQSHCRGMLGRAAAARYRTELADAAQRALALVAIGARLLGRVGRARAARWRCQRVALAVSLQVCWRGFAARKHLVVLQRRREQHIQTRVAAAVRMQTWWRSEIAKEEMRHLRKLHHVQNATSAVQRAWRSHASWRAAARRTEQQLVARLVAAAAATLVQAWGRRYIAACRMQRTRVQQETVRIAAISIQKLWRKSAAVTRLQLLRANEEIQARQRTAAVVVQGTWRRKVSRSKLMAMQVEHERLTCAVLLAQTAWRGRVCRERFMRAIQTHRQSLVTACTAAIAIQRCARGYLSRKLAQRKKAACVAATAIQTAVRKQIAARFVEDMRRQFVAAARLAKSAAIVLQSVYRGKAGRSRARSAARARQQAAAAQFTACTTVQAAWRASKARESVHALRDAHAACRAAGVLQRIARGKTGRDHARNLSRVRLQVIAARAYACTNIQAAWRAKCARREGARMMLQKKAATTIQTARRNRVVLRHTAQRRNEWLLQRKEHLAEQTQRARSAAATMLQSAGWRWCAQRRLTAQRCAALLLQSMARGWSSRSQTLTTLARKRAAATSIQTYWRAKVLHAELKAAQVCRKHAADSIQALFRGVAARKCTTQRFAEKAVTLSENRSSMLQLKRREVFVACATTIQAVWRGRRECAILVETAHAKGNAASIVQRTWRDHRSRLRAELSGVSLAGAVLIQCAWRGCCGRARARKRRVEADTSHASSAASETIQAAWRGWRGRVQVAYMELQEVHFHRKHAAATIQALSRGTAVRHDKRRRAAEKATALRTARRKQRKERYADTEAAICLQAAFRGVQERSRSATAAELARKSTRRQRRQKHYLRAEACVCIQAAFRGKILRRRAAAPREQESLAELHQARTMDAAICIQANIRAVLTRNWLAAQQDAEQTESVTALQAMFRGCVVRKVAAALQTRKRAASRIQARYRGRRARGAWKIIKRAIKEQRRGIRVGR